MIIEEHLILKKNILTIINIIKDKYPFYKEVDKIKIHTINEINMILVGIVFETPERNDFVIRYTPGKTHLNYRLYDYISHYQHELTENNFYELILKFYKFEDLLVNLQNLIIAIL